MAEMDDLELLLAAGRGDREAFGQLADRHHRTVIHYVHRFLGRIDLATAEDIAQDVFLRAWTACPSFTPRAKVLTWLLQIATNACLNHRRGMRLRRMFSLGDRDAAGSTTAGEPEGRDVQAEAVRDAIARFPDAQRAAIILRHYHDLSYTDIAAALEVSVSSVESLLFRSRRTLRAILEEKPADSSAPQVSPELGSSPS
ncbi:MAG: RNA polymerase sigma factor [Chloroflexi bacterium]|nr:RNA polymerase sigma factor [Chloroflexota bacterium]